MPVARGVGRRVGLAEGEGARLDVGAGGVSESVAEGGAVLGEAVCDATGGMVGGVGVEGIADGEAVGETAVVAAGLAEAIRLAVAVVCMP
jgi:hypothetical protein